MIQIQPQEQFPIVRKLGIPNDSNTYYVRAVLRNSITGVIIQVNGLNYVNLTDTGSQRFAKTISAPTDPSGNGLYVDITTSVYTDSGYTTLAFDTYSDELSSYLIQQRWNMALGMGGGGGEGISYKKIREIVKEEVSKIEEVDLSGVKGAIVAVAEQITKLPKPEKLDLSPVLKKIDFTPIIERLKLIIGMFEPLARKEGVQSAQDELQNILAALSNITHVIDQKLESMKESVGTQVKDLANISTTIKKQIAETKFNIEFKPAGQEVSSPYVPKDEMGDRVKRLIKS